MHGHERVVIDGQRHQIPRAWIRAMVVILQRAGHDPLAARVLAVLKWHEQTKTVDPPEEQRRRAEASALQATALGRGPSTALQLSSGGA